MNLYLIQTAKIIDENIHRNDLYLGGYRNNRLVDFNYMGAAEYEFGASRKSFRYIMNNFGDYQLFETEIKNTNGVPLQLFCHKEYKEETIAAIKDLAGSENRDRYLKEHCFLWTHCTNKVRGYPSPDDFLKRMRINNNFWWDFGNHWMAFFGAQDRANAFIRAINNDRKFYVNQAEGD